MRIATSGVELRGAADGRVEVRAAAGESWDELVARLVAEGLAGVECLAGIPGSTGATPIQNVGAYGQEVGTSLAAVRVLDRVTGEIAELAPRDCGLRYRGSIFKYSDRHRRARGHVRARARCALGADPLRGARSDAGCGARGTRPAGRRARSRARAAARQGHGPRRGRSRHLERRFVLHEPDPRAGGVRGSVRARPGCGPATFRRAGWPHQDVGGVADRAGGFPARRRARRDRAVGQARARAHQPRRRAPPPSSSASRARSRRRSTIASGSSCTPSPCSRASRGTQRPTGPPADEAGVRGRCPDEALEEDDGPRQGGDDGGRTGSDSRWGSPHSGSARKLARS